MVENEVQKETLSVCPVVTKDPLPSTQKLKITKIKNGVATKVIDEIATEEPLEIRVGWVEGGKQKINNIAVTMRTPGNDFELAAGFLLSEGIVKKNSDIKSIDYCKTAKTTQFQNIVTVELNEGSKFDSERFSRKVLTNSSCGICGRTSLEMVRNLSPTKPKGNFKVSADFFVKILDYLNDSQRIFSKTGGLHASALFDTKGECFAIREDVGRHNALDKVLGAMLLENKLPASDTALLVSGRTSFELVQKAIIGGIPFLAGIGAPSTLAVELAREFGVTLVGFLGREKCNVYSSGERVF
ncbi:MAG: formate dehydrogenase accessory sulfurtransferase FdhD [Calditrichaeota bacterium]|nr:MAG: formate dehydrogenase accessory sulfurtransferase FdhD [Calditrichota bacterium]